MNAAAEDFSIYSISDELDRQLSISPKAAVAKAPAPADLDELDELLRESIAQVKKSSSRKLTEEIQSRLRQAPPFVVIENASIWERVHCTCGHTTAPIFLHFKEHKTQETVDIWHKVREIDSSKPMRHFIHTRETILCGECCELEDEKLEELRDALGRGGDKS